MQSAYRMQLDEIGRSSCRPLWSYQTNRGRDRLEKPLGNVERTISVWSVQLSSSRPVTTDYLAPTWTWLGAEEGVKTVVINISTEGTVEVGYHWDAEVVEIGERSMMTQLADGDLLSFKHLGQV